MLRSISKTLPVHPSMRHPLTGEPLAAVGIRRNGDPIWPVLGAAEDDADGDGGDDEGSGDDTDSGDADEDDEGADKLGDAGKKALDRMKAQLKAERLKRRQAEKDRDAEKSKKDGDETDAEKIREQIRTEERTAALRDRVLDKIEAKAGGKFADPEDARFHLAEQLDDFIDNGRIDTDAIVEALDDLLDRKKYLAAQGGKSDDAKRKLRADRGQGARGGAGATTGREAGLAEAHKRFGKPATTSS
jgi:hypothetical protein